MKNAAQEPKERNKFEKAVAPLEQAPPPGCGITKGRKDKQAPFWQARLPKGETHPESGRATRAVSYLPDKQDERDTIAAEMKVTVTEAAAYATCLRWCWAWHKWKQEELARQSEAGSLQSYK